MPCRTLQHVVQPAYSLDPSAESGATERHRDPIGVNCRQNKVRRRPWPTFRARHRLGRALCSNGNLVKVFSCFAYADAHDEISVAS